MIGSVLIETRPVMDLLPHRKHNQPNSNAVGAGLSNLQSPYDLVFRPR
jgi:hypothetical protein